MYHLFTWIACFFHIIFGCLYFFDWFIYLVICLYYSLEKSHFSITYKSNIFSHFVGFLFLVASFDKQMFLISVKCNIQFFCLFFLVSYLKHSQTHNLKHILFNTFHYFIFHIFIIRDIKSLYLIVSIPTCFKSDFCFPCQFVLHKFPNFVSIQSTCKYAAQ